MLLPPSSDCHLGNQGFYQGGQTKFIYVRLLVSSVNRITIVHHYNMNDLGTDSTTRMALNLRIVTIPDIPDMIITIMAGVILKV